MCIFQAHSLVILGTERFFLMAIFLFIFFLLLLIYSLLIDFYRRSWNQIPVFEAAGVTHVKVSVVIAVRNEEHNISQLLFRLSLQDYPRTLYEVIIVNDHSTDATWEKLNEYTEHGLSTIFLQLPQGQSSKKKAIEMGINSAKGELIITSDADCIMPETWISCIASFYWQSGAKFISAPVLMEGGNSVKDIFQSLDFLALQGITGASVHKRFHTMCNGANLAYEKQSFLDVDGFQGIDEIPSGDDMLLMHKIFSRYPDKVFYLKSREAIVRTKPERSWRNFFNQRIRWASKAVHYKDKRIFYVLLLTYFVNIGFLVMIIASIIDSYWLSFLCLLLFAKILIEFPFVNAVAIFFDQQKLMRYFPFLQPLHILYTIFAGWLGRFGSYRWKSRTVKNKGTRKLVKQ